MPGRRDTRALTEWACVVSDASDAGFGAAEKEVGGSRPGTSVGKVVSKSEGPTAVSLFRGGPKRLRTECRSGV